MRLPPLNALRTFEAAARLGGFAAAAEELLITPAAVSQQIKTLETQLGVTLFHRLPRGLDLSAEGRELLPHVARGLAHLARGLGGLGGEELAGRLIVTAPPSLAACWLIPRIGRFAEAYPDITVRVDARETPPDLNADEADLRIAYGLGTYPGLRSQLLMTDTIFPVAAPALLNRVPLRRFADLRNHMLLQDVRIDEAEPAMAWPRWLRDEGVRDLAGIRWLEVSNSIMLGEAALRGYGVALGRYSLVADQLASGALIRPLSAERPSDYSYYAITSEAGAERKRVRAFLDWLFAEAAQG